MNKIKLGAEMAFVIKIILIFPFNLMTSCTTANYGDKFVSDYEVEDQYRFKIYIGGFQFAPPYSEAEQRVKEYMVGKEYKSFEIIRHRFSPLPSYYEFTVKFLK